MSSLTRKDFEVLDGGQRRELIDFQSDATAPASVALLIDGSGSMILGAATDYSRRISSDILASLDSRRDNAALLSFDTRLLTLCEFTRDFGRIRDGTRRRERIRLDVAVRRHCRFRGAGGRPYPEQTGGDRAHRRRRQRERVLAGTSGLDREHD